MDQQKQKHKQIQLIYNSFTQFISMKNPSSSTVSAIQLLEKNQDTSDNLIDVGLCCFLHLTQFDNLKILDRNNNLK